MRFARRLQRSWKRGQSGFAEAQGSPVSGCNANGGSVSLAISILLI